MTRVLLDGGMGTALLAAGLPAGDLPERWLLERPAEIAAVHAAHVAAGAQVVLTCTFNLAGERLDRSGIGASVEELAARAVGLARSAAPGARVAGSVGPAWLGGDADRRAWAERHGRALRALAAAGVDLLWSESHWELEEARAALAEGRRTGLPVAASFGFRREGAVLRAGSGESAPECLRALARDGAAAIGVNCSLPGDPLAPLLASATVHGLPVIAKPSAGLPGALLAPDRFGDWIDELAAAGATWVGGCCGAGAVHLAAVRDRLFGQLRG